MISDPDECVCSFCANDIDFEIDAFLMDQVKSGEAVIFAGAGISTENPNASPVSLYDRILHKVGSSDRETPFPDAVQCLVDRPDGYFQFISIVEEHFHYIRKFSDLRQVSEEFYYELSTAPYFNQYVTTNWDRSFEDICRAKPFVYDADMRFWDLPRRKVLKIHGTIDNYSTLVASRADYDAALPRLQASLVGGKLKDLLATKTCIFIGYSMKDEDFGEIFDFVKAAQGRFAKTHYFVNPFSGLTGLDNVKSIQTSGIKFLRVIKEHLSQSQCIIRDAVFAKISDEVSNVSASHLALWDKVDMHDCPQALPSALYQDGLLHGYKYILDAAPTGEMSHSCELYPKMHAYEDIIAGYRKKRMYLQIPYFEGYQSALIALLTFVEFEEGGFPPHFYYNGVGPIDEDDFWENIDSLPNAHKAAFEQAKKKAQSLPRGMVWQMRPWLA